MKLEIVFKDGRKETFDSVVSFNVKEEQNVSEECHTPEVVQTSIGELLDVNPLGLDRSTFEKPMKDRSQEWSWQIIQETFGELREVNPLGIDRSIFKKPMEDESQEWRRQIIQEAFAEVDKQPDKYALPFWTLVPDPDKNWGNRSVVDDMDLKKYAKDLGGLMADWVEQALECAQRISNGESWKTICNDADTAKWYRAIVWKDGYVRLVGGSSYYNPNKYSPSHVHDGDCGFLSHPVPLVTLRKKRRF